MTATSLDIPDRQQSAGAVEPGLLRGVCGLFVTGVTVITSGRGERAAGTTVNSFTSVSLEPPLVLFCLHRGSRLHAVVEETGAYTVNFLAARQEPLARAFAGKETARVADVPYGLSATGVPFLGGALAHAACRLVNSVDGGDHTIFVGEVVELGLPDQSPDPLVFFRGELGPLRGGSEAHTLDTFPVVHSEGRIHS
ncbi:flavin reductase family protein [Streptomyces sp. NPDC041068]|uniref:flavin reductase family protein n=1 Tax=Streptomyces sp. NPDC041068 TaxID=3155130 RepID=UPI0033C7A5E0